MVQGTCSKIFFPNLGVNKSQSVPILNFPFFSGGYWGPNLKILVWQTCHTARALTAMNYLGMTFLTGSESPIPAHHTVVFSNEEEIVSIENSSKENAAELLLIAGKPDLGPE